MLILGVSGLYHDSSAAIVDGGLLLAASHEERYTRIKQDNRFPINSIGQVLSNARATLKDIEKIVWYEDPDLKVKRSHKVITDTWPFNITAFEQYMSTPLVSRKYVTNLFKEQLNWHGEVVFGSHHESHMASSIFGKKGAGKTLALTVDGIGEFETATGYLFDYANPTVPPQKVWDMAYPNSIGLFYSAVTQLIGFEVNEGEYKVMGLAPYGEPKYLQNLISLALSKKSTKSNPDFSRGMINWGNPKIAFGPRLLEVFRIKDLELDFQEKADIAASVQKFLEYILVGILEDLIEKHQPSALRMAGGVALNCTANAEIIRKFQIPLDIQPAAGDAGTSAGAALLQAYKNGDWENSRAPEEFPTLIGSEVGRKNEVESFITNLRSGFESSQTSPREIAEYLSQGKVIALAIGKAEFGPRALGNRAILASPLSSEMKNHLNAAIKFREEFRPFAPVVCIDDYDDYFERLPGGCSKNMLLTVKSKHPNLIPAVTHVDGSSRAQELEKKSNPFLWDVLKSFGHLTGVPVLTLTSFNLKGEPIVQNCHDALSTFERSGIDILVIENWKIIKVDPLN